MGTNTPFFVDNETITLTRNGLWIADGVEISHEPTRKLFAKSLKKHEDGTYWLHIGRETKKIQVEDTAYFIIRLEDELHSQITLFINDETSEKLDPETLKYRPGRLSCQIKNKSEEAKFLHAPYFDLLKFLEEDRSGYFLKFGKTKVWLARK